MFSSEPGLWNRSLSQATSCALLRAWLEDAWAPFQSVPICSVEGHSLCLAVPGPSGAHLAACGSEQQIPGLCEDRVAAGSGQPRCEPCPRDSGCCSLGKEATEETRGNGQALWERQDKRKEEAFFPQFTSSVEWEAKKKKFSLELLFPSVVKQRVGHGGNGNRHSFNGWEIRRIILLLSHYMEKENIDVCLTMAEEVETSCLWWCHREEQKIIIEEKISSIKHILHIISCAGMFLEPSLVCLVFHSSLIFPFFPLLLMLFLCE